MRAGLLDLLVPLISSTPTLSRPTVGRSMSNTARAMAAPMMAKSTSWRGVGADGGADVEHDALAAQRRPDARRSPGGRSCAMVRRQNLDIAISAPVLPAETAASASPVFTASIAFHIDDFQRPWRSAWLGLSSMRTATSRMDELD